MEEVDRANLIDKLARHRTDNVKESDLLRMYYGEMYDSLTEYSTEELEELIKQEIDDEL